MRWHPRSSPWILFRNLALPQHRIAVNNVINYVLSRRLWIERLFPLLITPICPCSWSQRVPSRCTMVLCATSHWQMTVVIWPFKIKLLFRLFAAMSLNSSVWRSSVKRKRRNSLLRLSTASLKLRNRIRIESRRCARIRITLASRWTGTLRNARPTIKSRNCTTSLISAPKRPRKSSRKWETPSRKRSTGSTPLSRSS